MNIRSLALAVTGVIACSAAHGAGPISSINLGNYQVIRNVAIDPGNALGDIALEASAVTYARDRGSLFFVGDEGLGVVEISRTGATIGSMTFSGWPAASSNNDAEGLAYLGAGVLVVAEERLQDLYRFTYTAGGSVNLATADFVSIGSTVGNVGTEGIGFDPRTGGFLSVKQNAPQDILAGPVTFAAGGGTSSMTQLFDPALLGLASFSDIVSVAAIDALAGQPTADNLLILSLDSLRLVEATRTGTILSSFDLAGVTTQAIEGVTIDENGIIYLVAEGADDVRSRLIALAPIPEPETYVLMLLGLGAVAFGVRRRGTGAK